MTRFQTLKHNAQLVMTWVLTLIDGTQHTLIPVDAHGTVMDMDEDGDTWKGRLLNGEEITVPDSQVLMVERDRYRVSVNNGQGIKSMNLSDQEVERAIEKAPRNQETGEVQLSWKQVKDNKTGEIIKGDETKI